MDNNMRAFRDAFYEHATNKVRELQKHLEDYVAGKYASLWTLWRWKYILKTLGRRIRKVFMSERNE